MRSTHGRAYAEHVNACSQNFELARFACDNAVSGPLKASVNGAPIALAQPKWTGSLCRIPEWDWATNCFLVRDMSNVTIKIAFER